MQITELDTPVLLIDNDLMQANIAKMVAGAKQASVALRPHLKTAKSIEAAKWMQAAGVTGFCVAKISEAEVFAAAGITDLLITSELVGPQKLARMAKLHQQYPQIRVVVDSIEGVKALHTAVSATEAPLEVLIEINVGQNRCGVEPNEVLPLAQTIASLPNFKLIGVQGYEGHLQHQADPVTKKELVDQAMRRLAGSVDLLRKHGFELAVVTTGGTGTWEICASHAAVNEVQPGSFIFLDGAYRKALGPDSGYQNALVVLATIISQPTANRAVVDAGLKALSNDMGNAELRDFPQVSYRPGGDEYGILSWEGQAPAGIELGARVAMIPSHIDTTVNLYDQYQIQQQGEVIATWPLQARGKTQ